MTELSPSAAVAGADAAAPTVKLDPAADTLAATAPGPEEPRSISVWQMLLKPPDTFGTIRQAAKARQAELQRRLEKNYAIHNRVDEAIRGCKAYEKIRNMIQNSSVVLELPKNDPDSEKISLSYRQQGNIDMYSSENMKLRESNKQDEGVKGITIEFWNALPKTTNSNINKHIYKWMSRKLFFSFVPTATVQEFEKIVEEDWKNDAIWSSSMNFRMFRSAMFQLADVWCETTDAAEYRDFLSHCMKIVTAPPAYTGRRTEEEEDTETASVTNVQPKQTTEAAGQLQVPKVGVRRKSSDTRTATPPSEPTPSPPPEDQCDLEALHEEMEQDIQDCQGAAWFDVLRALSDILGADVEGEEENLRTALLEEQQKRYALLKNDKDPSFDLEKQLLETATQFASQFLAQRQEMVDSLTGDRNLRGSQGHRSAKERREARLRLLQQRKSAQVDHFNRIRDTMFKANVHNRDLRQHIVDLDKDRLQHVLEQLPADDAEFRQFVAFKGKAFLRAMDAQVDIADDLFAEFVAVSKDAQECRTFVQKRQDDPLSDELFPFVPESQQQLGEQMEKSTRAAIREAIYEEEEGVIRYQSPKWRKSIEWLQRTWERRDEAIGDALSRLEDAVKRIKAREKKHLASIHKLQMGYETDRIGQVAADPTVSDKRKLIILQELQERKKEGVGRRNAENEMLAREHLKWDSLVETLLMESDRRRQAEVAAIKSMMEAKNIEQASEAAGDILYEFSQVIGVGSVSGTPVQVPSAIGNLIDPKTSPARRVPPDVTKAADFLFFLLHRGDDWHIAFYKKLNDIRHTIFAERYARFTELEAQCEKHEWTVKCSLRTKRVEDLTFYKEMLANGGVSAELEAVLKSRIGKEEQFRASMEEANLGKQLVSDRIEQSLRVSKQLVEARRLRINVIFELEEKHMRRYFELEDAKFRQSASAHRIQQQDQTGGISSGASFNVSARRGRRASVELEVASKEVADRQRRRREHDEFIKEQSARERASQAAEEQRLADIAEADKRERDSAKKATVQRQFELRKKALEAKEKAHMEKLQREEEQRKKWREDFLAEEQRRKDAEQRQREEEKNRAEVRRKALIEQEEKRQKLSGKAAPQDTPVPPVTPPPSKTPRPSPPSRPQAKLAVPAKQYQAVAQTPNIKQPQPLRKQNAPSSRIRQAMETELQQFQTLQTVSLAINMENFRDRRQDYLCERASNATVYAMECTRLRLPISPGVTALLGNQELDFGMTSLRITFKANIMALLDVILLNPIQQLIFRGIGMDKDQCRKLCQMLLNHEFIGYLDLSKNGEIGAHGGASILALVKTNRNVMTVLAEECNIPPDVLTDIQKQTQQNKEGREIGRAEFDFLLGVFREVDQDHSGMIDMKELRQYNARHQALLGTQSTTFSSDISPSPSKEESSVATAPSPTLARLRDTMNRHVEHVRDVLLTLEETVTDSDLKMSLSDLMCHVYPALTTEKAVEIIQRYTDDSATTPSIAEMQQFIDTFGTDGHLSLKQLSTGLGEDADVLRPSFQECDTDADGFLSLEEFTRFVGA